MKLFGSSDDNGRICNAKTGLCTERSGHFVGKPGPLSSNSHLCTDFVEAGDTTHGQSKNNPHHCTACNETWPRR